MEQISYKLEVFEGPMDLLLHLINKHKIDINDIPILLLVEQYLDYVEKMSEEHMDVASEFLEMAARLVYLKTISLLPVYEEETETLKRELQGDLLEYQDCKIIASKLSEKAKGFDLYSRFPECFPPDMKYSRLHEPIEIFKAFIAAVGRGKKNLPPSFEPFKDIVQKKIVPIGGQVSFIFKRLVKNNRLSFKSFFSEAQSKSEIVATFLALLSLTKDKKIVIFDNNDALNVELLDSDIDSLKIEEDYTDEN